jgi:hypothetical protein
VLVAGGALAAGGAVALGSEGAVVVVGGDAGRRTVVAVVPVTTGAVVGAERFACGDFNATVEGEPQAASSTSGRVVTTANCAMRRLTILDCYQVGGQEVRILRARLSAQPGPCIARRSRYSCRPKTDSPIVR